MTVWPLRGPGQCLSPLLLHCPLLQQVQDPGWLFYRGRSVCERVCGGELDPGDLDSGTSLGRVFYESIVFSLQWKGCVICLCLLRALCCDYYLNFCKVILTYLEIDIHVHTLFTYMYHKYVWNKEGKENTSHPTSVFIHYILQNLLCKK